VRGGTPLSRERAPKEAIMKKPTTPNVCVAVAFSIMLIFLSLNVFAAETSGTKAINKELEKDIGMPVLDGNLWVKMTHDSKIAFIWGVWHVVSIEHYLMDKYPDLKRENFSEKVIEGSKKAPMTGNEIVALIDTYYRTNPDQIEKPVTGVIWASMIKPHIKTGIDGRPLKP
jgi:hypothetical protein